MRRWPGPAVLRRAAIRSRCGCAGPSSSLPAAASASRSAARPSPPAAPPSSSLLLYGWRWRDELSSDENYLDLAFLLTRNKSTAKTVACVLVAGVGDGAAEKHVRAATTTAAAAEITAEITAQGPSQGDLGMPSCSLQERPTSQAPSRAMAETPRCGSEGLPGASVPSGRPSGQQQGEVLLYGLNSSLFSVTSYECHAEANAVAEAAARGVALRGSCCYVTKAPCAACFALLTVAGVSRIVSSGTMERKQQASARRLGVAVEILPSTPERRERRDALAAPCTDRERVKAARLERKLRSSQSKRTIKRRIQ